MKTITNKTKAIKVPISNLAAKYTELLARFHESSRKRRLLIKNYVNLQRRHKETYLEMVQYRTLLNNKKSLWRTRAISFAIGVVSTLIAAEIVFTVVSFR